ncbi:MAG: polysaccharide deacetylase family protein [Clostridium sp.]|jgi:hypothetical protein|nr:polysaccharide deacetylase family protein [Clostridium sp.]
MEMLVLSKTKKILIILLSVLLLITFSGCAGEKTGDNDKAGGDIVSEGDVNLPGENNENTIEPTVEPTPEPTPTPINFEEVKPNEAGKIMIVMFHNFVETFTPTTYDNGEYTTTFEEFEKLLHELYEMDYRLISMNDYLNNNISVPAGCIPMVFTFDDGTSGQFNLVEENGQLVANKKSAVGIIEEFNKTYPDFGVEGTFYLNLGNNTFQGEGTLEERLQYLVDRGFEIGNHTYTHANLKNLKTAAEIQEQIGKNQKEVFQLVSDYKMTSFSLPFGIWPEQDLRQYVYGGTYDGIEYENKGILEVGWSPALSPVSKNLDLSSIQRVRASGINPVDADLAWWLKNLSREEQYVSDGNANTVAVPESLVENVDLDKLDGKELITY